ncbi:hypothetical protein OIU84_013748 [Salix udensis]|uniref:OBG-type G domain-containing protein n=1 Tax=Salix udensis TaxID=889485 RepID=A0AAD6JIQ3_9ROSI|nr:hypothetical protein OIU84_013748 [Salix udensis]
MYSSEATLADLPGLIEGARLGKGLGCNFLRHLRRTHVLVHVVDAAAEDPVNDYRTVKEIGNCFMHFLLLVLSGKGIRVNEMLKEIRAALRKCRDSHETLEPST